MANQTLDPVDYPSVVIGGVSYLLKHTSGAQLRMERLGFTPDKLQEQYIYEKNGEDSAKIVGTKIPVTLMFAWIASCAGTVNSKGKWEPIAMDPEEVADLVPMSDFASLAQSLTEMFVKAKPEGISPATHPASQPETVSNIG